MGAPASPVAACNGSREKRLGMATKGEAAFVRLAVYALQGVGTALDELERLSELFCSDPADRTIHGVPTWWHRSSSTNAFGKFLKSFCHSGRIFLFLSKFVDHFLHFSMDGHYQYMGKEYVCQSRADAEASEGSEQPQVTYTLVNQAFSVALKSFLDGYISALNTLHASVQLRRPLTGDKRGDSLPVLGSLTSIVHPEITLLEVYLHTRELRSKIEALGNICCLGNEDVLMEISHENGLVSLIDLVLKSFPRGANLLTYLFVQLRDADPAHYNILRTLFSSSCEPYLAFIKSWIYQGKVDDPHKEFIIEIIHRRHASDTRGSYTDDCCLPLLKENPDVCLPYFLEDMHDPLLRTGQQLRILIRLLDLCSYSVNEHSTIQIDPQAHGSVNSEDVLPCWVPSLSNKVSYLHSLAFNWEKINQITIEREAAYKLLFEKLEVFFSALSSRNLQTKCLVNDHHFGFPLVSDCNDNSSHLLSNTWNSLCFTSDQGLDAVSSISGGTGTSASDESENERHMESSSFDNSEEDDEFGDNTQVSDAALAPSDFYTSTSRLHIDNNSLQTSSKMENQLSAVPACDRYEKNVQSCLEDVHMEDEVGSFSSKTDDPINLRKSEFLHDHDHIASFWPLGGLLCNPFHSERENENQKQLHLNCDLMATRKSCHPWKLCHFLFDQVKIPENLLSTGKTKYDNLGSGSLLSMLKSQPLNYLLYRYNLSMNPSLTKSIQNCAFYRIVHQNVVPDGRTLSYFNFSHVEDPYKAFMERSVTINHRCQNQRTVHHNSSDNGDTEDDGCIHESIQADEMIQPDNNLSNSKGRFLGCLSDEGSFASSGGAKWAQLLGYSTGKFTESKNLVSGSEIGMIPLEVIIDRCIKQEILIQYNYVSSFTIKLLEEGFGLCEHFLALRRYHFMELSDWADLFTVSLWKHRMDLSVSGQRTSQIQSYLNLALERSSCENDPHKNRLYIYSRECRNVPFSNSPIAAFNFIRLGYKVDWPLSVVLNPEALEIYSDIFNFLMQVRIALLTLSDVWRALKGLIHTNKLNGCCCRSPSRSFSTFLKLRLQVNHFVTTLHQYVQSQLSEVSWCKFLLSLRHQVKDVLDLEYVHMSYLSDALHICFLSVETQTISSIIRDILQCALDFSSCITAAGCGACSDGGHSENLLAQINLSQVLVIKSSFEKSLNNLYLCYLKCPKHGEYGLSRLWNYLNYNGYYSKKINGNIWQ